jgi:subtilisin inhibitor-like
MVVNSYPFAQRLRTSCRTRCFRPHGRSDDRLGPTGRTGRFLLAGLAVAVLAVAGCSSAAPSGPGTPAKVMLKFNLTGGSGQAPRQWTLNCEPTSGGRQLDAAAACSTLLKLSNPFAPRSKGIACPMILRSDRKILVTGTWLGKAVHRVVLDGGCDMVLFSKLDKILQ